MATDPRLALVRLVDALESFHEVAVSAEDPESAAVLTATDRLADAYTVYDDVMFTQFGVELPFDVYDDVGDADSDDVGDADFDDDEDDDGDIQDIDEPLFD